MLYIAVYSYLVPVDKLTPKQNRALTLLAAGWTEDAIVAETGIGKRTIGTWKTNPKFKEKLEDAIALTYDSGIAELVAGSQVAARELKKIISDPDIPSKNKISAINVLFTHGARAKDSALERRLERLEESLDETDIEQD